MVLTKLLVVAALGVSMVGMWHLYNVGSLPPLGLLMKNAIITLPFTLTSILFIQTLSPMVIFLFALREKSIEVARHKSLAGNEYRVWHFVCHRLFLLPCRSRWRWDMTKR